MADHTDRIRVKNFCVSVPISILDKMKEIDRSHFINWSAVASRAFAQECDAPSMELLAMQKEVNELRRVNKELQQRLEQVKIIVS